MAADPLVGHRARRRCHRRRRRRTARVHEQGYHPRWHLFFTGPLYASPSSRKRRSVRSFAPSASERDVRHVVLTHLHTDHAGGLAHLTGSRVWVARGRIECCGNWRRGRAIDPIVGRSGGSRVHPLRLSAVWSFDESMSLTKRGDVLIVPTPGLTSHHVSVVVRGDASFFLSRRHEHNQQLLLADKIDGVSPDPRVAQRTHEDSFLGGSSGPWVYLPSHDRDAARRLAEHARAIESPSIEPARPRGGCDTARRHRRLGRSLVASRTSPVSLPQSAKAHSTPRRTLR